MSARDRSDEDLLDSLYGEREDLRDDGPRAAAAGADEEDELELAQLRRLRGVFAELKANQDEPPPAGMALLMAAARQAAEERKPQPIGLWARLRAGWLAMVAHPAMAAAAAAVVVIGASGYLMSRGVKTAESTYSSSESSSSAASAPSGQALDENDRDTVTPEQTAAATGAPADPAPPAAAAPMAAPIEAPAPAPPSAKLEMAPSPATKKAKSPPPALAPAPAAETVRGSGTYGGAVPRDRLEENFAKQNSAGASGGGASAQAPADAPPPPPPPPAAEPAQSEAESAVDAEDDDSSAAKDQRRPMKPSGVESITQQSERWYALAKEAAAKGDCNAVKLLAQRVQGENPGFYESRFRKDASIMKCL